jgi:hypothetical protein
MTIAAAPTTAAMEVQVDIEGKVWIAGGTDERQSPRWAGAIVYAPDCQ